jgi:hypothetical protein
MSGIMQWLQSQQHQQNPGAAPSNIPQPAGVGGIPPVAPQPSTPQSFTQALHDVWRRFLTPQQQPLPQPGGAPPFVNSAAARSVGPMMPGAGAAGSAPGTLPDLRSINVEFHRPESMTDSGQ